MNAAAASPVYFDPHLQDRLARQLRGEQLDTPAEAQAKARAAAQQAAEWARVIEQEEDEPLVQALRERGGLANVEPGDSYDRMPLILGRVALGRDGFFTHSKEFPLDKDVAENRGLLREAVRQTAATIPPALGTLNVRQLDHYNDALYGRSKGSAGPYRAPLCWSVSPNYDPLAPYEPDFLHAVLKQNEALTKLRRKVADHRAKERAATAMVKYVYPKHPVIQKIAKALQAPASGGPAYALNLPHVFGETRRALCLSLVPDGFVTYRSGSRDTIPLPVGGSVEDFCRRFEVDFANAVTGTQKQSPFCKLGHSGHSALGTRVSATDLPDPQPSIDLSETLLPECLALLKQRREADDEANNARKYFQQFLRDVAATSYVRQLCLALRAKRKKERHHAAIRMGATMKSSQLGKYFESGELILTERGFFLEFYGTLRRRIDLATLAPEKTRLDTQKAIQERINATADHLDEHLMTFERFPKAKKWWSFWREGL